MNQARSQRIRRRLIEDDPHCTYCRRELTFERATIDHVVPRRCGGDNRQANLVLACRTCNSMKGGKSPVWLFEWAWRILAAGERC